MRAPVYKLKTDESPAAPGSHRWRTTATWGPGWGAAAAAAAGGSWQTWIRRKAGGCGCCDAAAAAEGGSGGSSPAAAAGSGRCGAWGRRGRTAAESGQQLDKFFTSPQ